MNKWRVLSACLFCFGNGLNDSGKCHRMTLQQIIAALKTCTQEMSDCSILCGPGSMQNGQFHVETRTHPT